MAVLSVVVVADADADADADAGVERRPAPAVLPLHYRLTLLPSLGGDAAAKLYGVAWIYFEAGADAGSVVQLHGHRLDVKSAVCGPWPRRLLADAEAPQSANDRWAIEHTYLTNSFNWIVDAADDVSEVEYVRTDDPGVVTLVLDRRLVAGAVYRLGLVYTADVVDHGVGFFQTSYSQESSCCKK